MTLLRSQWDRVLAIASVIAGVIVLIAGYVGVSNSGYSAEQLPYIISGGIGGIFLLGLGAVLWLSADLRDEWRLLDEIREAIVTSNETVASGNAGPPSANGSAPRVPDEAATGKAPTRRRRATTPK